LKIAQKTKWMQTVKVRTTQNVFIEFPLASIGDRILAHLADRLILIIYSVAVAALLMQLEIEVWYVWVIFLGTPWLFFTVLFEIFMDGQTPGKQLLKIKVVRLNGTPATVGDYLMRWVFSFVDIYILSGIIAVVIIAMGGKGQRLGDIVAGTTVVKLVAQSEVSSREIFVTPGADHTLTFAQVSGLRDKDIELVQQALIAYRDQGNQEPVILIAEKIKSMVGIHTDMPPVKFLYTVVKDYQPAPGD
jgi:uncharacterized RDD family membrane protein YckC